MIYYNKNIDDIDKKIISLLQKDASLSIKEISSQIGLSPSPCWNRIQKLQELGIIKKKTAILDPNKLGYNNRVFIFIKTSKHNKNWSEKFKNYILNQNNVFKCLMPYDTFISSVVFYLSYVVIVIFSLIEKNCFEKDLKIAKNLFQIYEYTRQALINEFKSCKIEKSALAFSALTEIRNSWQKII